MRGGDGDSLAGDLESTGHILTVQGLEPLFWMLIIVNRTLYTAILICFTSALVSFSKGASQISQLLRPPQNASLAVRGRGGQDRRALWPRKWECVPPKRKSTPIVHFYRSDD